MTIEMNKEKDVCGFMILTPTPVHNGGLWCAEKYPCKLHGKWKENKPQSVLTTTDNNKEKEVIKVFESLPPDITKQILDWHFYKLQRRENEVWREASDNMIGKIIRNCTGYIERDGVKLWQLDLDSLESDISSTLLSKVKE